MTLRAAAVQLNSTEDTERNLEAADRLVREAAAQGARLIVLPEKWNVLGRGEAMADAAEPLDGQAGAWAGAIAAELGVDLVAGSILERLPGQARSSNTSLHVSPEGLVAGVYRKLHMFDVEVDGVRYADSEHEQPGDRVVVSELAGGVRLGLSICYDVRFPELYRALVARGAEILAVPSAFTLPTTRDHWDVLLRARAIENQSFVIAANQIGTYAPGLRSGGRSMIVDPWGVVLSTVADREGVAVADLDFDQLRDIRRRMPVLEHRRTEVAAP
jgi:predicted amidohydrolase